MLNTVGFACCEHWLSQIQMGRWDGSLGNLAQWNRAARQEVIAGAGHGMPFTHAAAVMAVLKDVLRE